jgi:hypothetical protein
MLQIQSIIIPNNPLRDHKQTLENLESKQGASLKLILDMGHPLKTLLSFLPNVV